MMRINAALFCALSALTAYACSFGGSGDKNTQGGNADAAVVVCGDGVCSSSEIHSCPQDCGSGNGSGSGNAVCGDHICESTKGETAASCPTDCAVGSGSGSGSGSAACPTDPNVCWGCIVTPATCPMGLNQSSCFTCVLMGSGSGSGSAGSITGCVGGVPNGTCDAGETHANCTPDCP